MVCSPARYSITRCASCRGLSLAAPEEQVLGVVDDAAARARCRRADGLREAVAVGLRNPLPALLDARRPRDAGAGCVGAGSRGRGLRRRGKPGALATAPGRRPAATDLR